MLTKKSGIILSIVGTFLCLLSVVYVSCTKVGTEPTCNGVICENGGYCNSKGRCVCPVGYEGTNCSTSIVRKFLGDWDVVQTVIASDNASTVGKTTRYTLYLRPSSTQTTFFINGFLNDSTYNQVVSIIDSNNSNNFTLDTTRGFNLFYDRVNILQNCTGSYDPAKKSIDATFYVRRLNPTHNWQNDTYSLQMSKK